MKLRRSLSLLLAVAAASGSTLSSAMPAAVIMAEEATERSRSDVSAEVKTSISRTLAFYGGGYRADVLHELKTLNSLSADFGPIYSSVVNMWDYIENDMPENISCAPDGLENGGAGHAFIVLGFALKSDGTMENELIGRLETALNCAEKYPNSYILVTGGVEKNGWTEGDRMHDWLIEHGVDESRILVENKAPDTAGNAANSFKILYGMDDVHTVSVISSQYHIKRGSILYYAESLLKAWELNQEPITFLPDMNAGWYRADKTSESLSLKVSSMRSICKASSVSASSLATKVTGLNITGPSAVTAGDELALTAVTKDSLGYAEDITPWSTTSGYLRYASGVQHPVVSYQHGSTPVSQDYTLFTLAPETVDQTLLENLIAEVSGLDLSRCTEASAAALNLAKENAQAAIEQSGDLASAYSALSKAALNLEELVNAALSKPVTANYGQSSASKITDGIKDTSNYWQSMNGDQNAPVDESYVDIDLQDTYVLNSVVVYPHWSGNRYYHYDVLTSMDGENWTLQDEWRSDAVCTPSGNTSTFETPQTARFIRIQGVKTYVPGRPDINNFHIIEAEAYGLKIASDQEKINGLKNLLAMSIEYAQGIDLAAKEHLNTLVKDNFARSLQEAVYVHADAKAPASLVEQAWKKLVSAIHMLEFTSDPSALLALIEQAEALDLDAYQDGEAKEELLAALEAARQTAADLTALDEISIAQAMVRLQNAMDSLVPAVELDTSLLAWLVAQTENTDLTLYTPASGAAFAEALASAKTVLEAPESQEQISNALDTLHAAWMNLRLLPDESLLQTLKDFVKKTDDLSSGSYSIEEVQRLTEARKIVLEALADPNLDQEKAENVVNEISPLFDLLDKGSAKTEAPKQTASVSSSVKTSTSTGTFGLAAAAGLSVLALFGLRRRQNKKDED